MVRASLGRHSLSNDVRTSATILSEHSKKSKSAYPCYALPIRSLLAMKEWRPHQELLEDGMLVNIDETPGAQCIFISHQWTSFLHPDPECGQLEALQTLIGNLIDGKMSVRTNPALEMGYDYHRITGPAEWKALLGDGNGHVWFDYISIPQPLAEKAKRLAPKRSPAGAVEVEDLEDDEDPPPINAHAGMVMGSQAHAGLIAADHRQTTDEDGAVAKLVEQLRQAVDSIPQYVERCIMMWVLVPPVKHADVDGAVCDFHSWRSRGWCRLEYAASNLARHDMPVLVVRDPSRPPEYFSPCDAMKVPAAKGNFTVGDDRAKVLAVLQKMVEGKVEFYREQGDYTLARLLRCFAPMITGGDAGGAPQGDGPSAVRRLKARLEWRDEATEVAWQEETGWNLLTCACLLDDLDAVRELLRAPNARQLVGAKGKKIRPTRHYHQQPFAKMLMNMAHGHRPLMGCMGYGSPATCRAMLEAGAPVPPKEALDIICGTPCHRPTGALLNGRLENMEVYLEYHPEFDFNAQHASAMGQTTLCIASSMDAGGGQQLKVVRWLLEKGALASIDKKMAFGFSPLHFLSYVNNNDSLQVMKLLREHGARASVVNQREELAVGVRRLTSLMRALRSVKPVGSKPDAWVNFVDELDIGGTPLHRAAEVGSVAHVELLLEMGADPTIADAKGRTPYQRCLQKLPAGSCQPQMLKPLLDVTISQGGGSSSNSHTPKPKRLRWQLLRRYPRVAPPVSS